MNTVLFTTPHGSRLYGTATEGSDYDYFVVVAEDISTKHNIDPYVGGSCVDTVTMGLDRFVQNVTSGSHQAVEALFSQRKHFTAEGRRIEPFMDRFIVTGPQVFDKYERTIKAFCYGNDKMRRHAVRLWWNLSVLRRHGRFNPEMTEAQKIASLQIARNEGDTLRRILLGT